LSRESRNARKADEYALRSFNACKGQSSQRTLEGFIMDAAAQLARGHRTGVKVAAVLQKRIQTTNERFARRVNEAATGQNTDPLAMMAASMDPRNWYSYAVDAMQRSVLFWDTLWQRGNNFVENTAQGLKPVLHFDYEIVLDGRTFDRPVNYALLRITPPSGVTVDPALRPYIIIDPRAGHGPGIGGFKEDSQVGVALRAGHPVYFVIFFRDPEPGQTLLDVCHAEQEFVKKTRALHPDSAKPAIIGNCQGGWAAMMLAASGPEDTGPIVINGAPMSYWGGAWSEGEGDNPMRYAGGMLGGSWLASLTADLGNGKFDGAHLVQNFENLNPANSLWDKFYHVFDKADTEPPRFLDFERWWGGYYLMNREEIEWITRNLFVGNKLWSGEVKAAGGNAFDLREIRSPIILFASMGDNITPPQQAFNWVADIYGSTEEIKARGQVIVGLLHKDVGHLGIFVSGKVAKKEHAQIVSVLKTIEGLAPGLYGMAITETRGAGGEAEYEVEFHEYRLEDIVARLNRFGREDEKAFEAVAELSEFNQRGYELFARPFVQATSNEHTAQLQRAFHPLRFQNWAVSRLNPWLSWLEPAAQAVKASRQPLDESHPLRRAEHYGAELVSASLDYYRGVRDAMTEAAFFSVYGSLYARAYADEKTVQAGAVKTKVDPLELPVVRNALAAIEHGGYVEALARVAFLLKRKGEPLPLSRLELRQELVSDYADYLPGLPVHEWRRIRGEQEIVVRYEPDRAVETLSRLLDDRADRERLVTLLDKLMADKRVQGTVPSTEQKAMLARIRRALADKVGKVSRPAALGRA
jgi:pimeloyl-ACP methyl ester carboxylesterase